MHRSVTFSEIFSSTFSDDLNKYDDTYDKNLKSKFVAKLAIGLIEFLLSSIFLCYGIIFIECINFQYYTVEDGLWTTILYISMWNITAPWSRSICEYFENNKYNVFKYIILMSTLSLFIGLVIPGQILSFGILGGIFSNLIATQLKLVATEKFNMDLKTFEGNVQVARALNLLIMPHFILLLVSYYNLYQVKLLYAAFLLNVIPAALIIRPLNLQEKYDGISRYQTLPAFSNQMREMSDFTNSASPPKEERPDLSITKEDDNEEEEEEEDMNFGSNENPCFFDINLVNEEPINQVNLTPLTLQMYYNRAGVSILPEIPEELEEDIEDNDLNKINLRRLSRISAKLEQINQINKVEIVRMKNIENLPYALEETKKLNQDLNTPTIKQENAQTDTKEVFNHTDEMKRLQEETNNDHKEILSVDHLIANKQIIEPDKVDNIEYIPNYKDKNKKVLDLRTINSKYCCSVSPYRKFVWKRRCRNFTDFILDNILKPLFTSIKNLHFYPTLMSKIITTVVSTTYITIAPYIAFERNKDFQPEDTTFLLSYIAFSWCLFLVLLPLVIQFSSGKIRLTFICGLLLVGTSMALISRKITNDVITISCLLFGFGYGIISYTENMVYRSFIGVRKWNQIEGTLQTTSALLVILTYYIIYHLNVDLRILLLIAIFSFFANALLWIIAPIFKTVIVFIKKYFRDRNQQEEFL